MVYILRKQIGPIVKWYNTSIRPDERPSVRTGGMEGLIFMKYTTYILKDDDGNLYKGMTNNMERRLKEHKSGHTKTTSRMKNLELAYFEEFDNFHDARKRELYFKSSAGRRFLKSIMGS